MLKKCFEVIKIKVVPFFAVDHNDIFDHNVRFFLLVDLPTRPTVIFQKVEKKIMSEIFILFYSPTLNISHFVEKMDLWDFVCGLLEWHC